MPMTQQTKDELKARLLKQPDAPNTTPDTKEEEPIMTNQTTQAQCIQEKPVTLETIREEAAISARKLSAAYATDSVSKINAARDEVKQIIDRHNAAYLSALFGGYLSADAPVLSAVTDGYCRLLRLKESKGKDGVMTVDLDYQTCVIDLRELEKAGGERVITKKGNWKDHAEKLALLFAARATHEINGDVSELLDKYRMGERARKLDMGVSVSPRDKNPISNRSLVTAVQAAVDSILFVEQDGNEYNKLRVTNADVAYMLYTMFRKGKKELSVSMPRANTIITALTEVMHKLVTNKVYSSEYDRIETKVVNLEKAS